MKLLPVRPVEATGPYANIPWSNIGFFRLPTTSAEQAEKSLRISMKTFAGKAVAYSSYICAISFNVLSESRAHV